MELNKRKREEEEEGGAEKAQKTKEEEVEAEQEKVSREMYEAVKTKNRDALKALCLKWKGPEEFDDAAYAYFDTYKDKRQRDAIMLATKKNDLESISILLDANAPTYNKDIDGSTALMIAAEEDFVEALKLLVKHSCVDTRQAWDDDHPEECPTALHIAALQGNPECCRILVEAGADIDSVHLAETPLIIAAKEGEHETVKVLLELGANTEEFEEEGWPERLLKKKGGDDAGEEEEEEEEDD